MAFFDDMKEALTSAGRDVSQKAKEVSEVTKLKFDIKSKEDELNKMYIELGKKYYEMNKQGEMPEQEITQISTLINEIADLKEDILKVQGSVSCPQCGAILPIGTAFCSKCGGSINS